YNAAILIRADPNPDDTSDRLQTMLRRVREVDEAARFFSRTAMALRHAGRAEPGFIADGGDAADSGSLRRLRRAHVRAELQADLPPVRVHSGLQRPVSHWTSTDAGKFVN